MQRLTARLDGQQPGRDGHLASSSADADQDTLQLWNEVMPFSSMWFRFSFCSLPICSLLLPSTSQIWACALLASRILSSMAIVRVSTDSLQQQRNPMEALKQAGVIVDERCMHTSNARGDVAAWILHAWHQVQYMASSTAHGISAVHGIKHNAWLLRRSSRSTTCCLRRRLLSLTLSPAGVTGSYALYCLQNPMPLQL